MEYDNALKIVIKYYSLNLRIVHLFMFIIKLKKISSQDNVLTIVMLNNYRN